MEDAYPQKIEQDRIDTSISFPIPLDLSLALHFLGKFYSSFPIIKILLSFE